MIVTLVLTLIQLACVTSGHFPQEAPEGGQTPEYGRTLTAAAALEAAEAESTATVGPEPGEEANDTSVIDATLMPSATTEPEPAPTEALPDYFLGNYPASAVSYVIPLSVRHVTESRAELFFELSEPAGGLLVYRSTTPGLSQKGEVALDSGQVRHSLVLEGLAPGAAYQAQVLLGNQDTGFAQPPFAGESWDPVRFQAASDKVPLRLGILGDASFGDEATTQLVNLMASQDLDFVIHTGDVVYETDSSDLVNSYVRNFYLPFAPLLHEMPVYTVLGNHDYDAVLEWQGAPFYDYAFPPFSDPAFSYPASRRANQYYAVAYQGVQFLFLDSQTFYGVEGRADQQTWLEERLADERFRFTIPIFHVAPYSSSVVHPDDGKPVQLTWNPLFAQSGVPVSFSGHFHHYERLAADGVTYIVSGGGSSVLYAQGEPLPESEVYIRRTHYVMVEIYEDRLELFAISKEGELLDSAVIELR